MMYTYISILRGINVGGKHKIRMEQLRNLYQNLGFKNVQSYIQSGNVVFLAKNDSLKKLEKQILDALKNTFGFEVPIMVKPLNEWKTIIDDNPFAQDTDKEEQFLHVTFLARPILTERINKEKIIAKKRPGEEVAVYQNAVYLYCPIGYGRTKLNNNFFERELKTLATTRNWKTTNRLLRIAQSL